MANKDQIQKWFNELEAEYKAFKKIPTTTRGSTSYTISGTEWRKWATSVQALMVQVFGENSPYYKNFVYSYENSIGRGGGLQSMMGVFMSAKVNYEQGYMFDITRDISGEIFGDFVGMAKVALSEGHKDVAAVLACAALEDTLKQYARLNDIEVDDTVMEKVVSALKAKGLVSGAQKSLLDVMPKIRNHAMHAEWDRFTDVDVGSVIGFVEQFLLTKFS